MSPEDNAVLTTKLNGCDWWARDVAGSKLMVNDIDALLDVTASCPTDADGKQLRDWLPEYIAERFGPGGCWDGLFLDSCWMRVGWLNSYIDDPIDIDRDGIADSSSKINEQWDEGMRGVITRLRELVGDDYTISTNGNNTYYDTCDGSTREDFPNMHGDWYDNITNEEHGYIAINSKYRDPSLNVINAMWYGPSTLGGPVRTSQFLRKFGLTFASTLVFGDGYYSLDGPDHCQAWWHEYYDLDLGVSRGRAERVPASPGGDSDGELAGLICARRFEKGIAVVNPTEASQTVTLPGFYYSPESWNGEFYPHSEITNSIELGYESGAVLVGSGRLLAVPAGLHGWRLDGANCLQWPPVEGAAGYSVYRVDLGQDNERVLVDVVSDPCIVDEAAKCSVSRYFVAAIDEIGCESQLSCPVEVSSELGSDLSLALVAMDEQDGTLALGWNSADLPAGCRFDLLRTDEDGRRVLLTEEPVVAGEADRVVDPDVEPGVMFVYEAVAVEDGAGGVVIGSLSVETRMKDAEEVGAACLVSLRGCHPHPMSTSTTLEFELARGSTTASSVAATVTIYDVSGRVVRRLLDRELPPGPSCVQWDGRSESGQRVASGCYLYAVSAGGETRSGKVLVVR